MQMNTEFLSGIAEEVKSAWQELDLRGRPESRRPECLGCSSSEIIGRIHWQKFQSHCGIHCD